MLADALVLFGAMGDLAQHEERHSTPAPRRDRARRASRQSLEHFSCSSTLRETRQHS
jgi:hypothetical protein